MTDTDALVQWLREQIADTRRIALDAQSPNAPAAGEEWRWEYEDSDCALVDQPVNGTRSDGFDHYLGEDVEYGWRLGLRSVETYPRGGYTLPNMVLHAEEVEARRGLHLAHHDPRTVLAQCDANAAVLDLHERDGLVCAVCADTDPFLAAGDSGGAPYPCDTVKALALAYQHHPGYREEWRP